jgi:hypothetical protein
VGEVVTGIRSGLGNPVEAPPRRAVTLVWIDSREAVVAGWVDDGPVLKRIHSDVPAHHRSTGHVRHDANIRHGGGGPAQTADEPRRLEHLERFVERVSLHVPAGDLVVIGPGTVREHLAQRLRTGDEGHRRARTITCEPAGRLTDRQLIARLRGLVGSEVRRRTVGAYRWTEPPERRRGRTRFLPRRVVDKGPGQPESD